MVRVLWILCWPVFFYGLAVDLFSLIFRQWEPLNCTLAGAMGVMPLLFWAYHRQAAGNRDFMKLGKREAVMCVFMGIAACLMVNTLIKISGLFYMFPGYFQTAERLYGPSLGLQICAVGAIIPVTEELVFRGLGFAGVRRELGAVRAAVFSSAVFAIYHGNMLQGIYGFVMGLLFAWAMERKKTILAPVLMHMAANLTSVTVTAIRGLR